jgi:hypothetical protein
MVRPVIEGVIRFVDNCSFPLSNLDLLVTLTSFQVDLKYITSAQIFEVSFEGRIRRFGVDTISSHQFKNDSADGLADDLQVLSVESSPELWIVGWDTSITVKYNGNKAREVSRKVTINRIYPISSLTAYTYLLRLGSIVSSPTLVQTPILLLVVLTGR